MDNLMRRADGRTDRGKPNEEDAIAEATGSEYLRGANEAMNRKSAPGIERCAQITIVCGKIDDR